jgi:hypothetical protein
MQHWFPKVNALNCVSQHPAGTHTSSHCFQTIYGQKEPFTCHNCHIKMTHPIPDLLFGSELESFKTKSILLYTF